MKKYMIFFLSLILISNLSVAMAATKPIKIDYGSVQTKYGVITWDTYQYNSNYLRVKYQHESYSKGYIDLKKISKTKLKITQQGGNTFFNGVLTSATSLSARDFYFKEFKKPLGVQIAVYPGDDVQLTYMFNLIVFGPHA